MVKNAPHQLRLPLQQLLAQQLVLPKNQLQRLLYRVRRMRVQCVQLRQLLVEWKDMQYHRTLVQLVPTER